MNAVCTQNLSLWFGSLQVLRELNLSIQEGEVVALLGPSGCGKSTLLRVIAGIIPALTKARVEGEITVFGVRPTKVLAGTIDMVFQESGLLSWRTASENSSLGLEILGIRDKSLLVKQILESVGLNGFTDKCPQQLSGGMRQRVSLASSLITRPKVILMDEPLASLDSLTRETMWQLIETLKIKNLIQTAIVVTHSVEEATVLADRVLLMSSCPCQIIENVPVKIGRPRIRDNGVLDGDCLELANYIRARIRGVANEKE